MAKLPSEWKHHFEDQEVGNSPLLAFQLSVLSEEPAGGLLGSSGVGLSCQLEKTSYHKSTGQGELGVTEWTQGCAQTTPTKPSPFCS